MKTPPNPRRGGKSYAMDEALSQWIASRVESPPPPPRFPERALEFLLYVLLVAGATGLYMVAIFGIAALLGWVVL